MFHAGGIRGLEEEERRISLWKTRFEMSDEQVTAMRHTFERMVGEMQGAQVHSSRTRQACFASSPYPPPTLPL